MFFFFPVFFLVNNQNNLSLEDLEHFKSFNSDGIVVNLDSLVEFVLDKWDNIGTFGVIFAFEILDHDFFDFDVPYDIFFLFSIHKHKSWLDVRKLFHELFVNFLFFLYHWNFIRFEHELFDCCLFMIHYSVDELDFHLLELVLHINYCTLCLSLTKERKSLL